MTDDAIFLAVDGSLIALRKADYDSEDVLQQVLAQFPELIAGVGTAGESAKLLLVRREMPVAAAGSPGLSLDHLFLDEAGVPVFVEVKRASDTRARREVVAQMLDYAANGVTTWENDLRDAVARAAGDLDAGAYLRQQLGIEDVETFWTTVEDNLRAGRIRLIFLADRLGAGLVRIIEFLNEQMRDVEVLGIELPQYTAPEGQVVYVPRVVGRTATAVETKQHRRKRPSWTEAALLEAASRARSEPEVALVQALLARVRMRGGRFSWGSGSTAGVTGWYVVAGGDTPVWNVNLGDETTEGSLSFILSEYSTRHPDRVADYARALESIPELAAKVAQVRMSGWRGWPSLALTKAAAIEESALAAIEVGAA